MNNKIKKMIKDIHKIHDWNLKKKRKYFWIFTILWTILVFFLGYIFNSEWLYFIPFLIGDIIFWKTINYTFWKERKKEKKKYKSSLRSWADAILFAIIAATLLRTFTIEAYTIPTPSMEKSLLVGDYLFVSKLSYGPRVPMTPLSFPLVHHTLPIIGGKSYLEWIKTPYHRMSGWRSGNEQSDIGVERNDCVVFNWPSEREGRPIDKKENYIKRCVALPGDSLEINDGTLFINGESEKQYDWMKTQKWYVIKTKNGLSPRRMYEEYGIYPDDIIQISSKNKKKNIYVVNCTKSIINELKNKPYVDTVWTRGPQGNIFSNKQMNPDGFLAHNPYDWDEDNYGPLRIPKKDDIVRLDSNNLALYIPIIKRYEGEEMDNSKLFEKISNEIHTSGSSLYKIKMNYYWMMGDNRGNSADSRFWGYVPENHIVGKSWFIWMSYDKNGKGIRWSRMYTPWMWIGLIIFISFIPKWIRKRWIRKKMSN